MAALKCCKKLKDELIITLRKDFFRNSNTYILKSNSSAKKYEIKNIEKSDSNICFVP